MANVDLLVIGVAVTAASIVAFLAVASVRWFTASDTTFLIGLDSASPFSFLSISSNRATAMVGIIAQQKDPRTR